MNNVEHNLTYLCIHIESSVDMGESDAVYAYDISWPGNSPHKWPVTRKMFPFGDVIMHWMAMLFLLQLHLLINISRANGEMGMSVPEHTSHVSKNKTTRNTMEIMCRMEPGILWGIKWCEFSWIPLFDGCKIPHLLKNPLGSIYCRCRMCS